MRKGYQFWPPTPWVSLNVYMVSGKTTIVAWPGSKCRRLWQVEVEPMYFNFALNLYMTLSSADNPFKQIGPRSGSTFCPDLIGIQSVWNFRGYDMLKLNRCILTLHLTFTWQCHLLITLSNKLDPDQARHCRDLIGVQTVWHLKGYDKLKLNRCILTLRLTFSWHCHLLITLSNNLNPDQARHSVRTW